MTDLKMARAELVAAKTKMDRSTWRARTFFQIFFGTLLVIMAAAVLPFSTHTVAGVAGVAGLVVIVGALCWIALSDEHYETKYFWACRNVVAAMVYEQTSSIITSFSGSNCDPAHLVGFELNGEYICVNALTEEVWYDPTKTIGCRSTNLADLLSS